MLNEEVNIVSNLCIRKEEWQKSIHFKIVAKAKRILICFYYDF